MTQQEFFNRYKYSIRTDKVGGGAFGTVYRAFDEDLNREVAIKVSEVKIMGGKEFSLKDEFDAIKELPVQRNIANYESLHTFEGPQGVFDYAVMQFYKDGNLSSFIKSNPTLAQKEQVALDLLEGINHLHKHTIVHRDLKPGNILIVKRGKKVIPVITDFGLSKNAKMEGQSRFSNSFGGGTLKYSSPEQLKAEKLRLNTDLWAYGVIIHEIFTGKNLFMAQGITGASAEAEKEIYEQIIGVDISEMLNELPAKWKQVVEQCLVRDGAKRIKSASALKELIINGGASTQEPESFIDDQTIISDSEQEEILDDETIIDDGTSTQKKIPKKEPVKEERHKKKQPKQQTAFKPKFAYDAKAEAKKKKKTLIGVGVVIALMIISGLAYAFMSGGTDSNWEMAQSINSIESYESYISLNPESEFVTEAKENLAWLNATSENTLEVYQNYVNEFPDGKFALNANDTIAWLNANSINTVESYQTYLVAFPEGLFKENANSNISSLNDQATNLAKKEEQAAKDKLDLNSWNKALNKNNTKSYKNYINLFPFGKYLSNANEKIRLLEVEKNNRVKEDVKEKEELADWNTAKKDNTKSSLDKYISYYPNGKYIDKAKKKLMTLSEKEKGDGIKNYEKGNEYFANGDYANAYKYYKISSDQGVDNGFAMIGHLYEKGFGVKQDYKTSLNWYQKGAKLGSSFAQNQVGMFYLSGWGVSTDYDLAFNWLKKSANQGYNEGQYNYAHMYENGYGVSKSYKTAIYWYKKAATQGFMNAQSQLGYFYLMGWGTSKDYGLALNWFRKSADQNFGLGQNNLGYMYENGYGVKKSKKTARYWYSKACNNNVAIGCDNWRRL